MKLFKPFRTRNVARDEETDRQRFTLLSTTLSSLRDEIAREQEGLRRRYEENQNDAGFALEAFDQMPSDGKLAQSVEQYSDALLRCEKRLRALQVQVELLSKIGNLVDAHHDDSVARSAVVVTPQ